MAGEATIGLGGGIGTTVGIMAGGTGAGGAADTDGTAVDGMAADGTAIIDSESRYRYATTGLVSTYEDPGHL